MGTAIDAVRDAYVAVHRGQAAMPQRMQVATEAGTTLVMPAHDPQVRRTSVKIVSVHPDNAATGHPVVTGVVVLLDAPTGVPLAVMDGTLLTALRTGAASGVATELLARPDARVLALIGAGAQAPWQVRAVAAVRSLEEVRISNRSRERAELLATELRSELDGVVVHVADSAHEALVGADIVCTATSASEPVLDAGSVAAGAHVNAVGSFTPQMRELPLDLLAGAGRVVVDQVEAALTEAGEVIDAVERGAIARGDLLEIGALIDAGAGPRDGSETTVFKSCGLALQDLHAATRALEAALAAGLGRSLEL